MNIVSLRNLLIGLTIGLIVGTCARTAFADSRGDDITIEQITKCSKYVSTQVSVTSTNSQVTFTRDTKAIYIENIGATNELFWDPSDGVAVADTSHSKLEPGDNRSLSAFATLSIGIIASGGETTTALVEACS